MVFVVGLVGNGLVLTVLGRHRCPWLLADCYLFQLALADLLLVLVLPFRATQFTQNWMFGEVLCKLLGAMSSMNSYSTVLLLAVISVERYLAIVLSMELYNRWKLFHTWLSSVVLWGICLGLSAVELHFRTVTYVPQARAVICHLGFSSQEAASWRVGLRFTSFVVGFVVPLLVMLFCYGRIFAKLHRARLFRKHAALRLLVVLLVLFVLFWAPFHGFLFVDSLQRLGYLARDCAWEKVLDFGLLFTESLGLVHCCLNPLVYAFVGIKFRRELVRLYRSWDRRKADRQHSSSQEHSCTTEHSLTRAIHNDYSVMM